MRLSTRLIILLPPFSPLRERGIDTDTDRHTDRDTDRHKGTHHGGFGVEELACKRGAGRQAVGSGALEKKKALNRLVAMAPAENPHHVNLALLGTHRQKARYPPSTIYNQHRPCLPKLHKRDPITKQGGKKVQGREMVSLCLCVWLPVPVRVSVCIAPSLFLSLFSPSSSLCLAPSLFGHLSGCERQHELARFKNNGWSSFILTGQNTSGKDHENTQANSLGSIMRIVCREVACVCVCLCAWTKKKGGRA